MLITFLIGIGQAATVSLNVKRGEEIIHPINLIVEDRVLIQFKVVGAANSFVHFSITFPNATIQNLGEIGDYSTRFVCDIEGEYTLNFTNNDKTEDKLVTLNYEIDHYIFGMPQMLFMVILIVIISIVGVAIFIGLSPKP